MKTRCPHCQKMMETSADTNGMEVECPVCKQKFTVSPALKVLGNNTKKTVFLVVLAIFLVAGIAGVFYIANQKPSVVQPPTPTGPTTPTGQTSGQTGPTTPTGQTTLTETESRFPNAATETLALPGGVELKLVKLPNGIFMGKYEVTQGQWNALMDKKFRWYYENRTSTSEYIVGEGNDYPMYFVKWDEAKAFCEKLNSQGYAPKGWKFTLPTEEQWEYACRAGTTTDFSYGDASDAEKMNFNGNYPFGGGSKGAYRRGTVEVGSLRYENAYGLSDMHGNVWEWCLDASDSYRAIRGGSWINYARNCRSAYRRYYVPAQRYYNVGFRVALVPVD